MYYLSQYYLGNRIETKKKDNYCKPVRMMAGLFGLGVFINCMDTVLKIMLHLMIQAALFATMTINRLDS